MPVLSSVSEALARSVRRSWDGARVLLRGVDASSVTFCQWQLGQSEKLAAREFAGTSVAGWGLTRVSLILLGMPTFALALSITNVSALVPLLLRDITSSSTVTGSVVALEGVLALSLPLWLGFVSDRTRTRFGRRLPFLIAGAPLVALALVALPWMRTLGETVCAVAFFYLGYFTIYPPYRALYPDWVAPNEIGRSQGIQTLFREIGLLVGLGLYPVLFTWSRPLPFVVSATIVVTLFTAFVVRVCRLGPIERVSHPLSGRRFARSALELLRQQPGVLRVLLANALWEFALAGIKTFVLLYILVGIGRSPFAASLLMAFVACVSVVAAPIAGSLADRFGTVRVMRVALAVFALGLLLPSITSSLNVLIPAIPLIGFGGAVAMTLPYALLASRLPRQSHGLGAGLYESSRGIGALLGPLVTGMAIDLARPVFPSTQGYGVMWLVVSTALFTSIPLLPSPRASGALTASRHARTPSTQ